MQKIVPRVSEMYVSCMEKPAGPTALVVFGASGDLTKRKLIPSLFELFRRELIGEHFYVIGCGRTQMSDDEFRRSLREAISSDSEGLVDAFMERIYFISGSYDDPLFYGKLKERIDQLNKMHKIDNALVFYLSVPPFLYPVIAEQLGQTSLSSYWDKDSTGKVRIVIEKPFGRDGRSAAELNDVISRYFRESQIYRIDHYLGKETVQNIMVFRFANAIFEPVWNRNFIDHVQITIAESVGVEERAGYYDKSGALRDMFQNHMLQMLALAAMEPPASFDADSVRDEKVKLLKSIRPIKFEPWSSQIVRGQYGPGSIDGKQVRGYRQEAGIPADSKTETYVAAKLNIDNWRWQGVPFYVRTGKRLKTKDTEIAIIFKKVPHSVFASAGLEDLPANVLILQIQPEEGISLQFQAKRPGAKLCIGTLEMSFQYHNLFGVEMLPAYARLLHDVMLGDQTLFNRYDSVQMGWQLVDPVLQIWEKDPTGPSLYPAGSESFAEADNLIEADGRKWRPIGQ